MQRNILIILILFIFNGCTHVQIVGFDKKANTVTVQGGEWNRVEDYQDAADKYCHGPAKLLTMQQVSDGSHTTTSIRMLGDSAVDQSDTDVEKKYNRKFSCQELDLQ